MKLIDYLNLVKYQFKVPAKHHRKITQAWQSLAGFINLAGLVTSA
jgi:hypothetical protein